MNRLFFSYVQIYKRFPQKFCNDFINKESPLRSLNKICHTTFPRNKFYLQPEHLDRFRPQILSSFTLHIREIVAAVAYEGKMIFFGEMMKADHLVI